MQDGALRTRPKARASSRIKSFARGIHHLALCTDDIKATAEFYTRVLGMPLVHAMKVPPAWAPKTTAAIHPTRRSGTTFSIWAMTA